AVARELTRERATRQGARVERLGRRCLRRRRRGDGRRRGGRRWRRLRRRRHGGGRPGWLRRLDRGPWRRCRGGWWRRDRCSLGEGGVEAQRLTLAQIELVHDRLRPVGARSVSIARERPGDAAVEDRAGESRVEETRP